MCVGRDVRHVCWERASCSDVVKNVILVDGLSKVGQ